MLYSYFYVAFVCGAGATWLSIAFARRHGLMSRPNPIVPQHTSAVAHLGGVGILLGAAATFAIFLSLERAGFQPSTASVRLPLSYAVGAVLFLTIGVFDDIVRLNAATKFLLQLLATVLFLRTGLVASFTGVRAADAALSALLVLTLVNAVNFTDVCDGLVGGLAVVMLPFLAHGDADSFATALVFAGACAGFLVFNLPPAKTFLGDAGSHLLGFVMAAEVLSGSSGRPNWPYLPAALLSLGVPLMELAFITAVRVRKGLPWWRGSPDHFSLRLQARGLSRLQTDLVAWATAAACCAAAWTLPLVSRAGQLLILGGALTFFAAAWRILLRWEVASRGEVAEAPPPSSELPGARVLRHQPVQPLIAPGAEPSDAGAE
jgi:UDP-GlcNAc:undecaprenyl-phosphate/decaprenyl-phosphate GlcNAc-1-phosphate transferase